MSRIPMDHFARQDHARRMTGRLLWLYLLAVSGIIGAIYLTWQIGTEDGWWNPETLAWISVSVVLIVGMGSLFKISQLSSGGGRVAEMLGGILVDPLSQNPQYRQLLNVVDEMSIASGVPSPDVYILPEDSSINAFAAGFTIDDAVIGVTRGTLERLTRDELQGVIAHEFSHILNGDMRLNLRLMGLLFGILCLAILGRIVFRIGIHTRSSSSSDGKSLAGNFLIMLAGGVLFLVGMLGVFFARLIQAAVSRQREYLADAAAVQFTRNPTGIASALYKIGKYSGRISSPEASEAGHLFFGNALSASWFGWLSTHPPIEKRIAAIDPHFDPESVRHIPRPPRPPEDGSAAPVPHDWLGHRQRPSPASLEVAGGILAGFASGVREEVRELGCAVALVYALLLDTDETMRRTQLEALQASGVTPATIQAAGKWFETAQTWTSQERVSLLDLAIPTLRKLSPAQYRDFRQQTLALIGADGQVHLFEYLLQKILARHLDRFFVPPRKEVPEFRHLPPLLPDIAVLLSAAAYLGQSDEQEREAAYQSGLRELLVKSDNPALVRLSNPGIEPLDHALSRLARATPEIRRQTLLAAGQVVMHDGGANEAEAQILRALADTLDCPVPPFVQPHEA